jgi:hypothetical protein
MELIIQNNTRLQELREKFNHFFPYLKLEFFYPAEHADRLFSKENMVKDYHKTLEEIRTKDDPGFIRVLRYHTVNRLERIFKDEYGIYVQVFRRAGNNWLQTTSTDGWSLARQNKKGKENSVPTDNSKLVEEDYHEQL